jgi:putative acetyltransferase
VSGPVLRRATPVDAPALAAVHHRSRERAMPWLPVLHTPVETEAWFADVVLRSQVVTVAEVHGRVLALSAVGDGWLEQLYVDPDAQGRGLGRALLDAACAAHPDGLRLHVFTRNERARAFYEAAGFVLVGSGDGAATEEQEPDCTYAWPGASAQRR